MKVISLLAFLAATGNAEVTKFRFAAWAGDPAKEPESIQQLPGTVRVFVNGFLYVEQKAEVAKLPVGDLNRVRGNVWFSLEELGPRVRRGKNVLVLEFLPTDPNQDYVASMFTEFVDGDRYGDDGHRDEAKGPVKFSVPFTSTKAKDLPWHHYPPVTTLTAGDKQKIAAMLSARVDGLKPDFAKIYEAAGEGADEARKSGCLGKVYSAGIRFKAAPLADLEFATHDAPEVVVWVKKGFLFVPTDIEAWEKLDEKVRNCAFGVLSWYMPKESLAVVKTPAGAWQVAYVDR